MGCPPDCPPPSHPGLGVATQLATSDSVACPQLETAPHQFAPVTRFRAQPDRPSPQLFVPSDLVACPLRQAGPIAWLVIVLSHREPFLCPSFGRRPSQLLRQPCRRRLTFWRSWKCRRWHCRRPSTFSHCLMLGRLQHSTFKDVLVS